MRRYAWPAIVALVMTLSIPLIFAQPSPMSATYLPLVFRPVPSPTPTNTPTATATPTVTPSPPTPTSTPAPGVHIVGPQYTYVDSINYLHLVGQVQNTTAGTVQFVKITANFFNASGQLVANDFTYTWLDELAPGVTTCFDVSLAQPAGWASYQFEPVHYSSFSGALPNLTVFNDSAVYLPSLQSFQLIGQVQNNEPVKVTFVQVVGTVFNATGAPTGCNFSYVNSTDLDPGQNSSFTLGFYGRDYGDVATYRLQPSGNLP